MRRRPTKSEGRQKEEALGRERTISASSNKSAILSETWDDIVMSSKVVNGMEAATSRVSPPSPLSFLDLMRLLKIFWLWNLSLVLWILIILGVVNMCVLYHRYYQQDTEDTENIDLKSYVIGHISEGLNIRSHTASYRMLSLLAARIILRFSLATVVLLLIRVFQRLSWYTTEFGTYENVKDLATYQDDTLLDKAWARGYKTCGWQDPTNSSAQREEETRREVSPQILFQPRPGFCGITSFNSTLRTFRAKKSDSDNVNGKPSTQMDDPYIQLHSLPRYVTLEEALVFFIHLIDKSVWSSAPIASAEIAGGGKGGFASYAVFKQTLKQMNHPTQPARILAIYGHSPLFFCHKSGLKGTMQKIRTFGAAHWSPIISYLEEEDLVLVMDINHTYGKRGYLVPSRRMYDAVNTKCTVTGKYRGLVLLRGPPNSYKGSINTATVPLLANPNKISTAMGKLKEAYYYHIATSTDKNVDKFTAVTDMMNSAQHTAADSTCVRLVILGKEDEHTAVQQHQDLHAVVSLHPMTFTNSCFLPRQQQDGIIDDAHCTEKRVRAMIKLFEHLHLPMTISVRGCRDQKAFLRIHSTLCSSGMVPAMVGTICFYLNILYEGKKASYRDFSLPDGFEIQELKNASASPRDSDLIRQWGQVVADSYGFKKNLIRYGKSPGQFFGEAYQNVSVGEHLHQFVCIQKKSDQVVGCSTLYYNHEVQPNVACMFNVCVLKEHRGLGLGKIMSQCVITEAANAGCHQVLLEASAKGQPMYEKLGFIKSQEDWGGLYVKLSIATQSWKWKMLLLFLEKALSLKNG